LWQVPSGIHGEYQVYVRLAADPFATDNSQASTISL
jgi:hypothetical protein